MNRPRHAFLSGATGRLLPLTVPFRFFAAAVAFHVLAWLALLAGAVQAPRFAGGLGWPLAALHLVTLGVLAMTAIGASLQLTPVATRQPVRGARLAAAIFWLYAPGVAAVALGMGAVLPWLLAAGALAVALALVGYAWLLGCNLHGARGMPGVVAHGWAALASLVATLVTASSLALAYAGVVVLARPVAIALHVVLAAYGFMGMLSLGLSTLLLPMFALASAPDERWVLGSWTLAVAALAVASLTALGVAPPPALVVALVLALAAVAIHLALMVRVLRTGMRRELGRSFALVKLAWAMLVASLGAALALALGVPLDGLATLFGVLLVIGWLLTFVLGVLQRIAPFLGSLHATAGPGRPPSPSALTDDRPLAVHQACHVAALALLVVAVVADSRWAATAAAVVGTAGAIAYATFFVTLGRRLAGRLPKPPPVA